MSRLCFGFGIRSSLQGTKKVPRPLILCIDDEELGLKVRRIVLEREGYSVLTALDGPTGLRLFADERVDAVVLDYFMPAMNGGEVAAEMRQLRPQVPIILLSAYINLPPEVIRTVDCTILKGDGPGVLLTKMRELLPPMPGWEVSG
jgi:CheY-like chemotaxis protein